MGQRRRSGGGTALTADRGQAGGSGSTGRAGAPDRPATANPTAPSVPDFFIVGNAKCGTTAIYEMLRRHPQVFMSVPKEPWFFAREKPRPPESRETSLEFTGSKHESLEDYLSLFKDARPDQRVGEASSAYLWSPVAARRIADARPDARIIAMFREPASFLRSLHLQMLSTHTETERSFRKAVELDGARREGRHLPGRPTGPAHSYTLIVSAMWSSSAAIARYSRSTRRWCSSTRISAQTTRGRCAS